MIRVSKQRQPGGFPRRFFTPPSTIKMTRSWVFHLPEFNRNLLIDMAVNQRARAAELRRKADQFDCEADGYEQEAMPGIRANWTEEEILQAKADFIKQSK